MFWRTIKEVLIAGYDHIGMLMVMNILFILASLPLITLPATIPMLSAAVSSLLKGERPSLKELWRDAGRYYRGGGLLILTTIGVTAILIADLYALGEMKNSHPHAAYLITGLVLCFLLIWLLMQLYVIPIFLAGGHSVFATFRKALLMVLDNFGLSLAFGATMLGVILLMVVTGLGPFVIMVSFLFLLQHILFNNLMDRYHGQQ